MSAPGNKYGAAASSAYRDDGGEAGITDDFGLDSMNAFASKSIRLAFIRKVYAILSVQLVITFGLVLIFTLSESSKGFARSNSWIVWVAFVITFGSIIALSCCGNLRRQFPINFILLGIFTLAEAVTMGIITAFYDTTIVVTAIAITAIVCVSLTLFAMQTKIDFTVYNGAAFVCLLVLMLMGLAMAFFPNTPFLRILYSGLGALLFSFFLLIDTQMIVGGNRSLQISPEEYILAVITLYLDILQLFLHILQLLNATK